MTGLQTEIGLDTTCRRAFSLGYEVVLVKDAHSTISSERLTASQMIAHHNEVLSWFADIEESADIEF